MCHPPLMDTIARVVLAMRRLYREISLYLIGMPHGTRHPSLQFASNATTKDMGQPSAQSTLRLVAQGKGSLLTLDSIYHSTHGCEVLRSSGSLASLVSVLHGPGLVVPPAEFSTWALHAFIYRFELLSNMSFPESSMLVAFSLFFPIFLSRQASVFATLLSCVSM